ncbi:glutathione S-transferase family protein [soil metagenome]
MSAPYILYGSPGTASLCVHWLLIDLGASFEFRSLDFESAAQKDADYLRLNPQGRVPTLIFDGAAYTECTALLMLLAERHPEAGLAPAPGFPGRGEYLERMVFLANALLPAYRNWFYADTDGDASGADAIKARSRLQIETAWAHLDGVLADGRPYLLGAKKSVADHLTAMLARWSRAMPHPATAHPNVKPYVDRLRQEPGLRETHRREGLVDWIDD